MIWVLVVAATLTFALLLMVAAELHDVRRAYNHVHAQYAAVAAAYAALTKPAELRRTTPAGLTRKGGVR